MTRTVVWGLLAVLLASAAVVGAQAAPSCPVEDPAIRTAARNKIYFVLTDG
jgi:hypothetical protein